MIGAVSDLCKEIIKTLKCKKNLSSIFADLD